MKKLRNTICKTWPLKCQELNVMKKVKLNEEMLFQIIRESVKRLNERRDWDNDEELPDYERDVDSGVDRYDDYGEVIKKGGQGYGINPDEKNRQGYNQDGSKGPWFSRSVAMATAVLLNDNGQWYVLANERGEGTPDYQGRWNLPCGYLDYNEDAMDGARREVYEETGVQLRRSQMKQVSVSSDPRENRQNVCILFYAVLNGGMEQYPFSKANMEEGEVGGIKWVPIEDTDSVKWAFWHNRMLKDLISKLNLDSDGSMKDQSKDAIRKALQLIQNGANKDEIINVLQSGL